MEDAELLQSLRPPHLPLMPVLTLGESLAAAILFGVVTGVIVMTVYRLLTRQPSPRREALKALDEARRLSAVDQPTAVAATLRRLVARVDKPEYANLSDDEWLRQLDATLDTDFFTKGGGQLLGDRLYRPMQENEATILPPTVGQLVRKRLFWRRKR